MAQQREITQEMEENIRARELKVSHLKRVKEEDSPSRIEENAPQQSGFKRIKVEEADQDLRHLLEEEKRKYLKSQGDLRIVEERNARLQGQLKAERAKMAALKESMRRIISEFSKDEEL